MKTTESGLYSRLPDSNFLNHSLTRIRSCAHRIRKALYSETGASYWNRYNVTQHRIFSSATESLAYFHWRNDQYIDYIRLMPVSGLDGKVVLDFGCGPGNDLVGFGTFSKPARLIGIDVSPSSLQEARERLKLHGIAAETILIGPSETSLPIESSSVDYIHSSGVIHHIDDAPKILSELERILKPGGEIRIMVYNYDSVFLHLHVAYLSRIIKGLYRHLPIREAFARFTDGEECPVVHVYKPEEFIHLAGQAGLQCDFLGAAVSIRELADLEMRWRAIMHPALEEEHRQFLIDLRLDERGIPRFNGIAAGQDGCYRLRKRPGG
jgi:SAM-dependent methyltransferase